MTDPATKAGALEARFLGLRFDRLSPDLALDAVIDLAASEHLAYVVTPNVDHVVRLHDASPDSPLWEAYERASLVLCDSRILALLARWSGLRLPPVPGSDLTLAVLSAPRLQGSKCLVIGGTTAMLDKLAARFPQFAWRQHVPPQGVLDDPSAQDAIIDAVIRHGADLNFFAIGCPQSELICARIAAAQLGRGVALCIGASLEFAAGIKRRSPRIWQTLHLEWLFRLLSEPRRLWRRYLLTGPRIFAIWLARRRRHDRGPVEALPRV